MKTSRYFGKTLRDAPSEAETVSHRLLLRAGMVQQLAAGIYSYLPLGWRSLSRIKTIIREEMDRAGAIEVNMPVAQPRELWEESGRADTFVPPLAQFEDRRGRQIVLAPTHEEAITAMVRANVRSYRDLPFTLYQIQTKFRDEPRPRAGLLRVREFEMKDAYSFDAGVEGLDVSFNAMADAYHRIFARCGLKVVMVEADSGPIGGKDSNEFVLLAESGEDTILLCEACGYAANSEKADFKKRPLPQEPELAVEAIHTPGIKTIEALARSLGIPESKTAKAVFYSVSGQVVLVTIRGDLEVNETKLRNALGGAEVRLATAEQVAAAGLVPGSASAVGLNGVRSIVDDSMKLGHNFVAGANRPDHHLKNVNFPRDFKADLLVDLAMARAGDACPRCDGKLIAQRGIEVGHIFKLGTGYAEKMGASYLDESGGSHPIVMGCYGIGVGRLLGAAIEANHDARGMTLPRAIAPFEVYLAGLGGDAEVAAAAEGLYGSLREAGFDVLFDDRNEPPGVKFNDADLMGIPVRVVVSTRSLKNRQVELKLRKAEKPTLHALEDAVPAVRSALEQA
ncbi:MAG: proline--tRNA ligase [SAR202 cluster bacterium]|nr:proline--tRNA ligase [SAR202 cluster bacterium]